MSILSIRTSAVGAACAIALLTAGCGSSSDGNSSPQPSGTASTASTTTGASPSGTTGGGGSPSGDLISWAGDFCDAVRPMVEKLDGFATPTGASDPAAFLARYKALILELGPAMAGAGEAIAGLDAPPIGDGEAVKQQMVTLLNQSGTAFDQIADTISGLDPSDPQAIQKLQAAMTGIAPDLQQSSQALDDAFSNVDMTAALAAAPQCAGLNIGS